MGLFMFCAFVLFGGSSTERDKAEERFIKEEARRIQRAIEKELEHAGEPANKAKVEVIIIRALPNGWQGDRNALALAIVIHNPEIKEKVEKPYADYYQGDDKYTMASPRMTRYAYFRLDAGYSFGMMERAHPATLEAVTENYVIIAPPSVGNGADYKSKLYAKYMRNALGIKDKKQTKRHLAELKEPIDPTKADEYRTRFPDAKAVIASGTDDQTVESRVYTIRHKTGAGTTPDESITPDTAVDITLDDGSEGEYASKDESRAYTKDGITLTIAPAHSEFEIATFKEFSVAGVNKNGTKRSVAGIIYLVDSKTGENKGKGPVFIEIPAEEEATAPTACEVKGEWDAWYFEFEEIFDF